MTGRRCSDCGSRDLVRIVFGFPSAKLVRKADKGKVVLGGCLVRPGNPEFQCNNCQGHPEGALTD